MSFSTVALALQDDFFGGGGCVGTGSGEVWGVEYHFVYYDRIFFIIFFTRTLLFKLFVPEKPGLRGIGGGEIWHYLSRCMSEVACLCIVELGRDTQGRWRNIRVFFLLWCCCVNRIELLHLLCFYAARGIFFFLRGGGYSATIGQRLNYVASDM